MLRLNLKKLMALLMALAITLPTALSEEAAWSAQTQIEAPLADAFVPEQAETELPVGDQTTAPAPEVWTGEAIAIETPAAEPVEVAPEAWTGEAIAIETPAAEPVEVAPEAWTGEAAVVETPAEEPADVPSEAWTGEAAVEAALAEPMEAMPEPISEGFIDPIEVVPPVLAVEAVTLGVKEKYQLTLASGEDPVAVGAVFTSSNAKIVTVDPTSGLLQAKKKGSATITMAAQGQESACTVSVVKAPKKIKLSSKKLTLGAGEEAWLSSSLTKGSASAVTYSTSNADVVLPADNSGHLVAVGPGTATVTARTFNGKKATCKVTVVLAPEYILLTDGALTLWQGRKCALKPVLSPGSGGGMYCASSDPGVVSVDGLTLRGEGLGTATVTVSTYNGLSATAVVQVTQAPAYRALLVGEVHFPDTGMSNLPGDKDVALLSRMLRSVKGPSGNGWAVTGCTDLTAAEIHSAIRTAFAGATEGDVSLFYISTHGDQEQSFDGYYPEYAGYLHTYPDYAYSNWYDRNALTLVALAAWLSEVPGQVIVLIDSCGSGAAIYNPKGVSAPAFSTEDFDGLVVDAFSDVDKGVLAPGVDEGAFVLENKFFVLTSAAYQETGWSRKGKYSYFSKWLSDSIKTKGKMPADADRNKTTTLNELYNYMKKLAGKKVFKYAGGRYKQHVQVYPANSGFELFCR